MRPLGHDNAKEERVTPTTTIHNLIAAWEEYSVGREDFSKQCPMTVLFEKGVEKNLRAEHLLPAMRLIAPIRPSIDELNSLVFHLPEQAQKGGYLGLFLTAGYQLAPERKIVYPFDTPKLSYLGAYLCGKELRIDGAVGDAAGNMMVGVLRVRGSAESFTGQYMIGVLENKGRCGKATGIGMIGTLREGDAGPFTGEFASGVHFAPHPIDSHFSDFIPYSRYARSRLVVRTSIDDGVNASIRKTFAGSPHVLISHLPRIRPYARRISQRRYKEFLRAVSDPHASYEQRYTELYAQNRMKVRW
jgi:hypothetical protein